MDAPIKVVPWLYDGDLTLMPLALSHIEMLRQWRNANRQYFFTQDEISHEQQMTWFRETHSRDMTDYCWIAHLNGTAVGTGSLNHIDLEKGEAEWSRLIIPEGEMRGQGLAHRIAVTIRDYGIDVLKLTRIYGSLWSSNTRVLKVDVDAGYVPYKIEGDVTHVELWRKDWR